MSTMKWVRLMKKIVVIDGQGGKVGRELCERLSALMADAEIVAIGTNSIATASMLKVKGIQGATGENPVIVASRNADVIVGPIGIVVADSLLGEITPAMATAVGQSSAQKVLIPMNRCSNQVVGVKSLSMNDLIEEAISMILKVLDNE